MMTQFESLMTQISDFTQHEMTDELRRIVQITAENQRGFESGHRYDLEKFGLTESQIRQDCEKIYRTFLI